MMDQFPLLMFAAGRGTRMGALGAATPKCLIKVAGKTLLDHALALASAPPVSVRAVNLHYKSHMIRKHLSGQDITFSDETDGLLETGGGLRHALPLLGPGPVMTLNTDAVWSDASAINVLATAWKPHMDGLMMLVPQDHAIGHLGKGDFAMNAQQKLGRGQGYIYTGLQIVRPELLASIPNNVFSMNLLWDLFLTKGSLYGVVYDGQWCDVGQPQSIQLAEDMIGRATDV